jgi:hypothetical protein
MAPSPVINIAEAYDGRSVLITGATGEWKLPFAIVPFAFYTLIT